jgi:hypothetical protein
MDTLNQGLELNLNEVHTQIVKIHPIASKNLYTLHNKDKVNLTSRSIISHYFSKCLSSNEQLVKVESLLEVSREQTKNISSLIQIYQNSFFTTEDFKKLGHTYGFNLTDFSRLNLNIRMTRVRIFYDQLKLEYPVNQWRDLCTRTFDQINNNLSPDYRDDEAIDYLASIPDEFIPHYWDTIKPFFYLNGQTYPDHYILRRFIKYFYSYGTIEQFLDFSIGEPMVFDESKGSDERWRDFFLRAKRLMPNNTNYQAAIHKIYYQDSVDPKANHLDSDLVKIYCFGLLFLEDINTTIWLEEIFTSRGYDEISRVPILNDIDQLLNSEEYMNLL